MRRYNRAPAADEARPPSAIMRSPSPTMNAEGQKTRSSSVGLARIPEARKLPSHVWWDQAANWESRRRNVFPSRSMSGQPKRMSGTASPGGSAVTLDRGELGRLVSERIEPVEIADHRLYRRGKNTIHIAIESICAPPRYRGRAEMPRRGAADHERRREIRGRHMCARR